MNVQELSKLKVGSVIRNIKTKDEYRIIMKFQFSVNSFLGSGVNGHARISEINMDGFELIKP